MKTSKPFQLLILAFITTFSAVSCAQTNIEKPEDIGKQVFAIVQLFPDLSLEDYESKMMTLEKLQPYKKVAPKAFENVFSKVTQEEISKDYKRDFEKFQALSKSEDADWKNISYADFSYELDSIEDLRGCKGLLTLKKGKDVIEIKTMSFYNGEGYMLVGMKPQTKFD